MSKRLWVLPVLVAVMVALGSGAGFASMPSLLGGTGVVSVPNAMVAPMGQVQTALVYQRLEGISQAIDIYDETETLFRDETVSLWGIQALAAVANGAELWAAYSKDNSDAEMKTWGVGGKYQFPTCDKNVNLAVGAAYRRADGQFATETIDLFDLDEVFVGTLDVTSSPKATGWDAYLAATWDLTSMGSADWCGGGRLLGTAGVIYKKVNLDADVDLALFDVDGVFVDSETVPVDFIDDSLTRPFVAVEFLGQDRTSLGVEYRWKDNTLDEKAVFSAVLRHDFVGGFTGAIGVTNSDQLGLGLNDQNWFAMVGYNFGVCK